MRAKNGRKKHKINGFYSSVQFCVCVETKQNPPYRGCQESKMFAFYRWNVCYFVVFFLDVVNHQILSYTSQACSHSLGVCFPCSLSLIFFSQEILCLLSTLDKRTIEPKLIERKRDRAKSSRNFLFSKLKSVISLQP